MILHCYICCYYHWVSSYVSHLNPNFQNRSDIYQEYKIIVHLYWWYQEPTSSMVLFGNGSKIFTQTGWFNNKKKQTSGPKSVSVSELCRFAQNPNGSENLEASRFFLKKIDQFAATAFNKSRFFQGLILQWSGMDHLDKKFLHSVLRLDCHPYVILTWRIHIAAIYLHLFIVFSMFDLHFLNFNLYSYMWCIVITKLSNPIYSNMLVRGEYALSMSPLSHGLATKRSFSHPEGQTKYMNHYCNNSWQLLKCNYYFHL